MLYIPEGGVARLIGKRGRILVGETAIQIEDTDQGPVVQVYTPPTFEALIDAHNQGEHE
jgi:hypothetical protein